MHCLQNVKMQAGRNDIFYKNLKIQKIYNFEYKINF